MTREQSTTQTMNRDELTHLLNNIERENAEFRAFVHGLKRAFRHSGEFDGWRREEVHVYRRGPSYQPMFLTVDRRENRQADFSEVVARV